MTQHVGLRRDEAHRRFREQERRAMNLSVGRLRDQSAVRRLVIDDVTFTYVVDGAMAMDPEWFTPSIPLSYWYDHLDQLDASTSIAMSAGGLLVERAGHRLLIDAGLGEISVDAGVGRTNSGDFMKTLAALGIDRASIDVLAFTHLHQDHTGWAFVDDGEGARTPNFPNATYVVAEGELAAQNHHQQGELALLDEYSIVESLRQRKVPRLIRDGETISDGVAALVTPGHSPGHTSYIITSIGGNRLVVFGDVFHTPAQLGHGRWTSAPDVVPKAVPAARARLIKELLEPNTLGFGFHFGDQSFGRVVRGEGTFLWQPVATEALLPAPRRC